MSAVDTLLSRRSISALTSPAPEGEVLDRIMASALRAPDHGRLRPWRFLLIRGEALAKLADLAVGGMRRRMPDADQSALDTQRAKMSRAPLIVALVARLVRGHKVSEAEQIMSAAAAGMNILNAVHAEGFGAVWISGPNVAEPVIIDGLGLTENERLIGFLFVGTPSGPLREPSRPDIADHVSEWHGPNDRG